ncbi:MAG: FAD-dependent oxidoreductase [Nanoarchaeota archaeon]
MQFEAKVREFEATVTGKEQITPEIIKLTLTAPEDFSFIPGQFVVFVIERDGVKKPRSYSIFDSELKGNELQEGLVEKKPASRNKKKQKTGGSEDKFDNKLGFIIKIIEGGFAGGKFKELKLGDKLEVKGPFGHFVFDEQSKNEEHWFIGCGCGLAPLYNMITANVAKFPRRKFVLLVSVKTKKDLIFHDLLLEMEKKHANFKYIPSLTREEWAGKTGRVQRHLPESAQGKTFYICGMAGMVSAVKEHLLNSGVKPEDIKFERYS